MRYRIFLSSWEIRTRNCNPNLTEHIYIESSHIHLLLSIIASQLDCRMCVYFHLSRYFSHLFADLKVEFVIANMTGTFRKLLIP